MNNWRKAPIVAVDVETTGLDWTTDEIIDVGFVVFHIDENGANEKLASGGLVKPKRATVSPEIECLTGITQDMLENAPSFLDRMIGCFGELCELLPELGLLEGEPCFSVCAYNAGFDQHMLSTAFARFDSNVPKWLQSKNLRPNWIDPLVWAEVIDPYAKGKERYKLVNVASRLNVLGDGQAHRAISDARTAGRVLGELAKNEAMPKKFEELMWKQRLHQANNESRILKFMDQKKEEGK